MNDFQSILEAKGKEKHENVMSEGIEDNEIIEEKTREKTELQIFLYK